MAPELLDIIELVVDVPEHALHSGNQGVIVHCYPDGRYEVEFSDEEGETVALCPLSTDQFVLAWQAKTRSWLSRQAQNRQVIS